jgi:hypothetical protein
MTAGPPFTMGRYDSLGACITAEREWLAEENERLSRRLSGALQHLEEAREGLANYAQENAHLHSTLTYRLRDLDDARAELHRIRNQSLEWALSCPHDCPECDRLYDAIRGDVPQSAEHGT